MKKIILLSLLGSAVFITGCETTSSRPYSASTKNIIAFKKAIPTGKTVNVGDFKAAEGVDTEPSCRALGALEVSPGKTPMEFIEDAFREEIFEADAYDESGTLLSGTITKLKPDSIGKGTWTIGLNMASPKNPAGIDVSTLYEFKSSYSAISACQNVIDAFTPAVQETISKVIAHPEFQSLL